MMPEKLFICKSDSMKKRMAEKLLLCQSAAMQYVPEELIKELLLRLPIKSLLRFKAVSKLWLSLISDPDFAKSHFDRSSMDAGILIFKGLFEGRSIDFEGSLHHDSSVRKLSFPLSPPYRFDIMGSCRGFLLLSDYKNLFVWNPSSGACKTLSYLLPSAIRPLLYGLYYDNSTDDYWVVLVYFDTVQLFSLKSNSWKEIVGTRFPRGDCCTLLRTAGITLNGTIHGFIDSGPDAVILGFDLTARDFREFRIPNEIDADDCSVYLEILGGCLCLSNVDKYTTEIWIMKKYGVKSSWTKSVIAFAEHVPYGYFRPICSTKGGDIIGLYDLSGGLMKYNREGKLLEHRPFNEYGIDFDYDEEQGSAYDYDGKYDEEYPIRIAVCTASLLSLPNCSDEGGEDKQH